MSENDRVSTREHLEHQINALRDHIDQKFAALEQASATRLHHCFEIHDDHEARIRAQEKVAPVKNITQAVIGIVAVVGAALGMKQP